MNLYIVRHGTTTSNIDKKYYGSYESELTQEGIKEAELLRGKLKSKSFDYIFCSERERSKDTLKIILGDKENIIIDGRLNERDFGIFENKTYEEINNECKEFVSEWERNWKEYKIPQGESAIESYNRTADFFKYIEKLDAKNILIVTHGGFIRNTYCYILGSLDFFWKFNSKNGDLSVLKYEYGNWYIDSITHIGEEI